MKETMKSLAYLDTLTALSYGLLYESQHTPITDEFTPEQFENTADIEKESNDDNIFLLLFWHISLHITGLLLAILAKSSNPPPVNLPMFLTFLL